MTEKSHLEKDMADLVKEMAAVIEADIKIGMQGKSFTPHLLRQVALDSVSTLNKRNDK